MVVVKTMKKIAIIMLCLLITGLSSATTITWINAAGGDYTNGANWTGGVAPGPNDVASFSLTNALSINVTAPAVTNNAIWYDETTNSTINLNGNTFVLSGGDLVYRQGGNSGSIATTNMLTFINGTITATNNRWYLGAGGYPVDKSNIAALTFSNITFNAKKMEVAGTDDGGNVGNGTWSLYGSTATVSTLVLAHTGGGVTPGTGNIMVANGSLLTVSNAINAGYYGDASGICGNITVSNATFNPQNNVNLGYNGGGYPANGHLYVVAGGQLLFPTNANLGLSAGYTAPTWGTIFMDGAGSVMNMGQAGITLNGLGGNWSTMQMNNGTINLSNGYLSVGSSIGSHGAFIQSSGTVNMYGSSRTYIATVNVGQTGTLWLVGNGNPQFNALDYVDVGCGGAGAYGELGVSNGMFHATGRMWVGNVAGCIAHCYVPGGTLEIDGGVIVGAANATGTVLVTQGGTLDLGAGSLTVAAPTQNTVYNIGGVFQFAIATPSITPGTFGNVAISSGTVSFRAITTADVFCNQSGKSLDYSSKIGFVGTNSFMLNSASNTTSGQSYLFSSSYGATNWANLYMVNGYTRYRGASTDTLKFDSTASHNISNTTAQIDLVYTNAGSFAVYNSSVTFLSNATFNGGVTLGSSASTSSVIIAQGPLTLGAGSTLNVSPVTNGTILISAPSITGRFLNNNLQLNQKLIYSSTNIIVADTSVTITIGTTGNIWTISGTNATINCNMVQSPTSSLNVVVNPTINLLTNTTIKGSGSALFNFNGGFSGNYTLTKTGTCSIITPSVNVTNLSINQGTFGSTNVLLLGSTATNITTLNTNGTISVTNGGNAKLIIGQGSQGTLNLYGGKMNIDQLIATNNSRSATPTTNSYIDYVPNSSTNGTINIFNGFTYFPPTNTTFDFRGNWSLLGGTSTYSNFESTSVNPVSIGYDAFGNIDPSDSLLISGSNTIFNVYAGAGGGWQTTFQVLEHGRLTVNSNAVMNVKSTDGSLLVAQNANMVIDNASVITPQGLRVGNFGQNYISGHNGTLTVTNHGLLSLGTSIDIGVWGQPPNGAVSNGVIVSGGIITNSGYISIGYPQTTSDQSFYNYLSISSGGAMYTKGTFGGIGAFIPNPYIYPSLTNANNYAVVSGTSSLWSIDYGLSIGSSIGTGPGTNGVSTNNTLTISNGGTVIAGNVTISPGSGISTNNGILVDNSKLYITNTTPSLIGATGHGYITVQNNGSLIVTNGGNGKLIVGNSGVGILNLYSGCNMIVDQLFVTNNPTTTNQYSTFSSAAGTTNTILNGSTWYVNNTTYVPVMNGIWNFLGGTTLFTNNTTSGAVTFGDYGSWYASGSSTVVRAITLDNQSGNGFNFCNPGSVFIFTNGATLYCSAGGGHRFSFANTATSLFNNASLILSNLGITVGSASGSGGSYGGLIVSNNSYCAMYSPSYPCVVGQDGSNNFMVLSGNSTYTNNDAINIGGPLFVNTSDNYMIVSLGSKVGLGNNPYGQSYSIIVANSPSGNGLTNINNRIIVTDSSSVSSPTIGISIMGSAFGNYHTNNTVTNNYMVISNSAVVNASTIFAISSYEGVLYGASNNIVSNNYVVINGGSLFTPKLQLGYSNTVGNTFYGYGYASILNSGVLEANTITNVAPSCYVTNNAGTYQFTTATPSLYPNGFGNISLVNGTASFRAINTADVLCNQNNQLTNIMYSGNNSFQLNNSTNLTTNQVYTFGTGTATNWTNLILTNASQYRGGSISFGSGGSLIIQGLSNSVVTNVTFASGSTNQFTIASTTNYGSLNIVSGLVNFTNSVLQVNDSGYIGTLGDTFTLIKTNGLAGTYSNTYSGLTNGATVTTAGNTYKIYYTNNVQLVHQ